MNIAGYKSTQVNDSDLPVWENFTHSEEHADSFNDPCQLNPVYDTLVYNVEDCDRYTHIETALNNEVHLGMALKWNPEGPEHAKKKLNFCALLAFATLKKV